MEGGGGWGGEEEQRGRQRDLLINNMHDSICDDDIGDCDLSRVDKHLLIHILDRDLCANERRERLVCETGGQ